ncbi:MAG: hypothetical protein INR65_13930 [Gluconacetobacter diazotrophicus]|nr:hypothetical protein [Gluconacetobacter diazotrophicus]
MAPNSADPPGRQPELPLDAPPAGATVPVPRPGRAARRAARIGTGIEPTPDPPADLPTDLFDIRPEPTRPAPAPSRPPDAASGPEAPRTASVEAGGEPGIAVQRVMPASLVGGPVRPDPFLYLVVARDEADRLLRDGIRPDPAEPPRLVERDGVLPLLSALEEDGTGTADIAVVRLRRTSVANLIEHDPDGPGGYLLTGSG